MTLLTINLKAERSQDSLTRCFCAVQQRRQPRDRRGVLAAKPLVQAAPGRGRINHVARQVNHEEAGSTCIGQGKAGLCKRRPVAGRNRRRPVGLLPFPIVGLENQGLVVSRHARAQETR